VLLPLALAACGTLLDISPEPDPTPAPTSAEGGSGEAAVMNADAAAIGDALATDAVSETDGTTCGDVMRDDHNCGTCGHVCNIAGSCSGGQCARRVFVTSAVYTVGGGNNPHSLGEADAICQSLAASSGLENTFRAWMSDSSDYPANGARFTESTQPYVRMDGTTIAASFSGLISGSLMAPIDIDENGASVPNGSVWTGTRVDGQRAPTGNCVSWSDDGSKLNVAFAGDLRAMDVKWTESSLSCGGAGHLYCFEQ
jgi:stigma-specific protein Stig1